MRSSRAGNDGFVSTGWYAMGPPVLLVLGARTRPEGPAVPPRLPPTPARPLIGRLLRSGRNRTPTTCRAHGRLSPASTAGAVRPRPVGAGARGGCSPGPRRRLSPSRLARAAAHPGTRSRRRRSPDATPPHVRRRFGADEAAGRVWKVCAATCSAAHPIAEKPVLLSFADHGRRETDHAGDRRASL